MVERKKRPDISVWVYRSQNVHFGREAVNLRCLKTPCLAHYACLISFSLSSPSLLQTCYLYDFHGLNLQKFYDFIIFIHAGITFFTKWIFDDLNVFGVRVYILLAHIV